MAESGLFGSVHRSETVIVRAFNEKGEQFSVQTGGLLARIIQHEYDHIEGNIFLDRLKQSQTLMSKNEYLKMKRIALKK